MCSSVGANMFESVFIGFMARKAAPRLPFLVRADRRRL
jgi:hypothetical protein